MKLKSKVVNILSLTAMVAGCNSHGEIAAPTLPVDFSEQIGHRFDTIHKEANGDFIMVSDNAVIVSSDRNEKFLFYVTIFSDEIGYVKEINQISCGDKVERVLSKELTMKADGGSKKVDEPADWSELRDYGKELVDKHCNS